jgi:Zn-dependent peptidase ImmA (M78 family)
VTAPERKAVEVLDAFDVRAPEEIDVEALAAALGAFVVPFNKGTARRTALDATLVRAGDRGVIGIAHDPLGTARGRFSIAHEIGHFLLHEGRAPQAVCGAVELERRGRLYQDEAQANAFARELLMPQAMFAPRCALAPTLESLRDLATLFGTSLLATSLRAAQIGPAPLAVVVSSGGVVRWSARAKHFPFGIRRGLTLGRGAFARAPESLDYHLARGAYEAVRAEDFGGKRGTVQERSIRSGALVMTLLLADLADLAGASPRQRTKLARVTTTSTG